MKIFAKRDELVTKRVRLLTAKCLHKDLVVAEAGVSALRAPPATPRQVVVLVTFSHQ